MGFWTKVEKWSEKSIEGLFKQKFFGAIQPVEISKMISREMRDQKRVSVSKIYIPNEYTVWVSKDDWEQVSTVAGSLATELRDFISLKAEQRKYALVGPPQVKFEEDNDLEEGMVKVKGRYTEILPEENTITVPKDEILASLADKSNVDPVSEDTIVSGDIKIIASLTIKSGKEAKQNFPLGTKLVTIGRRRTSDLALPDENVSRFHAEISYSDGFHHITDSGSTNGVFVNGARVLEKKLMDGDEIKLGNSVLEYKVI